MILKWIINIYDCSDIRTPCIIDLNSNSWYLPPEPGFSNVVVSDSPLAAVQGKFLLLHLLEDQSGSFASSLWLKPWQDTTNPIFTNFLHVTKDTSAEEDLCMAKAENRITNISIAPLMWAKQTFLFHHS